MATVGGGQIQEVSCGQAVQRAVHSTKLEAEEARQQSRMLEPDERLRILAYHEVVPEDSGYLYSVTVARFEEHLRLLCVRKNGAPRDTAATQITFDDGHITCHECALPLLEQHRVPATFFVTTEWIGRRPEFMTWAHLQELVKLGHQVQSHGWTHKLLTHCPEPELSEELSRSKRMLEDKLGATVNAISVPGGRWNRRTLRAAAAAGYARVYLSDPWMEARNCEGVRVFGRLMVHRQMDAERLRQLIEMRGTALVLHRALHGAKEAAKSLLGDAVYQRLWRLLARQDQSYAAPAEKH